MRDVIVHQHDPHNQQKATMKRIEWLLPFAATSMEDLRNSSLASIRLRAALCAQTAEEHGITTEFSDGFRNSTSEVIFVGKIDYITDPQRPGRWLSHLLEARERGVRIVVDYTDHHLSTNSPAARFYHQALPLANTVICSSSTLAAHLSGHVAARQVIIEDPIEIDFKQPKARDHGPLTALWFGHASNLPYLVDYLLTDFSLDQPLRLILMSNAYPLPPEYVKNLEHPKLANLDIQVVPWSLDNMVAAAEISDFCLLPAGLADPRKSGASSNRLLTALALGLPVAADLLPSYLPFRNYFAALRSDEIKALASEPASHSDRIDEAQAMIKSRYTFAAIAPQWLEEIRMSESGIAVSPEQSQVTRANETSKASLEVLVITYQQAALCDRIIANVESYASKDIHVLIQDDCSPDETYDRLARHFSDHPYVKVFRTERNLGPRGNSSTLIDKARAEYCLNIGGDDFVSPHEIREALALVQNQPTDVAVFACARTRLPTIDKILFAHQPLDTSDRILIRNEEYSRDGTPSGQEFFFKIATQPGALWGQGMIIRTSLLQRVQLLKSEQVDDWGLFHNLAVHALSHTIRVSAYPKVIALLAIMDDSFGSDVTKQLTRQVNAVMRCWHPAFRKQALINVLGKKLEQFRNADCDAEFVASTMKASLDQVLET